MRVSDSMNYDQVKTNLSKNRREMADLQGQAATMKKMTKPSDDPVGAARVLKARSEIAGIEQFEKDLNNAKSFLDATDQAMEELSEIFMRAKELALQQASASSANPSTRKAVATEVDQLFNQMIAVGNRMLGDRYIFGGYKTTTPPFTPDGQYSGDKGLMTIEINKDVFLPMNLPGNHVFMGDEITNRNVLRDEYEAAPRTMADLEKIQDEELQEKKDHQRGKSDEVISPTGDEHRRVKTRSLASTKYDNEIGQPNQNAENGFDVLRTFSTALKTNDTKMIQDSLDRIDNALDQVVTSRAQVGSRSRTLDTVMSTLQKARIDAKAQASSVEDADAYELFSDITKNEGTLQATLQTSGKLIQPSLLDFLR